MVMERQNDGQGESCSTNITVCNDDNYPTLEVRSLCIIPRECRYVMPLATSVPSRIRNGQGRSTLLSASSSSRLPPLINCKIQSNIWVKPGCYQILWSFYVFYDRTFLWKDTLSTLACTSAVHKMQISAGSTVPPVTKTTLGTNKLWS